MKDISKGDLIELIEDLPACIKNDKYRIATNMLPSIQNWVGGVGKWGYESRDGELEVCIWIRRTQKYQNKIIRESSRR